MSDMEFHRIEILHPEMVKVIREEIAKKIEAIKIESGVTNAIGMQIEAARIARYES